MSVHFSFNECGVSVLHMFLEQTLDAHGHRIPSKHGEERGEEGDNKMKSIFFRVDCVEFESSHLSRRSRVEFVVQYMSSEIFFLTATVLQSSTILRCMNMKVMPTEQLQPPLDRNSKRPIKVLYVSCGR